MRVGTSRARADRQGCTECGRFPTPCVPRPVQTGGGRSVTPLFHSARRLWVACSSSGSQVARHLPGHHSSVDASPLRCRTGLFSRDAVSREDRLLVPIGGLAYDTGG